MYSTDIVTSFLKDNEKILLLKRSSKVKSMKCLWAGISGILEKNETPLSRAKIEIFEETGIKKEQIELVNAAKQMKVLSPQYKNHEWNIFPFLFKIENPYVKLNWENSEFKWIEPTQLINYKTVPDLDKILSNLL
jgi:8-oxo-dGTP pyrophosphatase MutT (NUDIX family)|tara:strand:+ start:866 stop:1270 length:405 start_codon:yes stop_codon:yes gene_type:complete